MSERWTEVQDRQLREIAARGSRQDAARELGRSVPAIKRRVKRLGLRFAMRGLGGHMTGARTRNWTPLEQRHLEVLVGDKSIAQIAKELGRSKNAVASRINQHKLDAKQGRYTILDAARILGVSDGTVVNYRKKLRRRWCMERGAAPGLELEDIAEVAAAILREPTSQVTVSSVHLRRIAEGDVPVLGWPHEPTHAHTGAAPVR